MTNVSKVLIRVLVAVVIPLSGFVAQAKPFKRVLVISGGGINPGVAVGIIAGVQASGWKPDLIIATCGAGIGGIVNNSEKAIDASFKLMKSKQFYEALSQVQIETSSGLKLVKKLDIAKNTSIYPDIFENLLLHAPNEFPKIIKTTEFNRDPAHAKLILVSSKANFDPKDVGQLRRNHPLFQQVYFTDSDTAKHLHGWNLPDQFAYPNTTVQKDTLAVSNYDLISAMRAGIADPYLLNPSILDGNYYFTGAVDLYPIDLAVALGDEVVTTYPANLFQDYEDTAFMSGFGFKQTDRALEAIQHKDVKWIDIYGLDDLSFNPKREMVSMKSGIPSTYTEFEGMISQQWSFGFDRAKEAIQAAPGAAKDVRSHLRRPINPKLREEFSCKNANEWKTGQNQSCVSDATPGCDRTSSNSCTALR